MKKQLIVQVGTNERKISENQARVLTDDGIIYQSRLTPHVFRPRDGYSFADVEVFLNDVPS
jgi:hypothetical protein